MPFSFPFSWQPSLKSAYNGLRGPLIAALLAFLAALPCALMLPAMDRDESRFIEASAQMLESHDFININFQQTPRWKKPVAIYWMQAASAQLFGGGAVRDAFPYRLPSLLGIALAAFAIGWGGARAFGTRTGTKAALLFAVSFIASTEAFSGRSDALLTGCISLFMAALARIYLATRDLSADDPRPRMRTEKLVLWLAMAWGILTKGPEAPLVMALTLVTLGIWDRKWRWMRSLGFGWGLILCLAICGPWAVAITITTDGGFWRGAVGHDLATKFSAGGSEGHFMWPGYHTLLLPLTVFPMAWLLGGAVQTAIQRRNEAAIRYAIAWFVPTFLFFELLPTKLPHYTLPALGGLAWLAAVSMDLVLKRWAKWLNLALGALGGVILSLVAVAGWKTYGGSALTLVLALVTVLGGIGIAGFAGWLLWRRHRRRGFLVLLAAGVICHLGFWATAASLKPIWLSRAMEQALVVQHLDPRKGIVAGPVATLGYSEPSFVFRMGTLTQLCNDDANCAVTALAAGQPVFVEGRYEAAFWTAAHAHGLMPHAVTEVDGLDYSNGRKMALKLYDNPPAPPGPEGDAQ